MRSSPIIDPTRFYGFLCFSIISTLTCIVFSDSLNEATMVPVCVFCPWARILQKIDIINDSKYMIAIITATYQSILYLIGEFAKVRAYVFALCLHCIAAYFTFKSISIGRFDVALMMWGMLVAILLAVFYYSVDLYWLKTNGAGR